MKDYSELDSDDENGLLQDSGSDYEPDSEVKKKKAKLGIFDDTDSDEDFEENLMNENDKKAKSKKSQPPENPPLPPKPSLKTVKQKIEHKETPSVSSFFQKLSAASKKKEDSSSKMLVYKILFYVFCSCMTDLFKTLFVILVKDIAFQTIFQTLLSLLVEDIGFEKIPPFPIKRFFFWVSDLKKTVKKYQNLPVVALVFIVRQK